VIYNPTREKLKELTGDELITIMCMSSPWGWEDLGGKHKILWYTRRRIKKVIIGEIGFTPTAYGAVNVLNMIEPILFDKLISLRFDRVFKYVRRICDDPNLWWRVKGYLLPGSKISRIGDNFLIIKRGGGISLAIMKAEKKVLLFFVGMHVRSETDLLESLLRKDYICLEIFD